jgi:hypothetical protein
MLMWLRLGLGNGNKCVVPFGLWRWKNMSSRIAIILGVQYAKQIDAQYQVPWTTFMQGKTGFRPSCDGCRRMGRRALDEPMTSETIELLCTRL